MSLTLTKDAIKQRQKLNVQETDLRIRRQEGLTLGEKIEVYLEKKVKKNASSLITDSFYNTEIENGISFYVRRTNVMKEGALNKKE